MYMRHNDVYILAVTKSNANVMLSFQFMTQVRFRSLVKTLRRIVQHKDHNSSLHMLLPVADSGTVQKLLWW